MPELNKTWEIAEDLMPVSLNNYKTFETFRAFGFFVTSMSWTSMSVHFEF